MSSMSNRRRVVITGLGVVSPAGSDFASYWKTVTSGKSALSRLEGVPIPDFPVKIVGAVSDAGFTEDIPTTPLPHPDRVYLLARTALLRALRDSKLGVARDAALLPAGFVLGTGVGPSQTLEDGYLAFARSGYRALRPRTVPWSMFNTIGSHLAIEFGIGGTHLAIGTACSSANSAMCRAVDLIRSGAEELVFTGGAEMPLCQSVLGSWVQMRVLALSADPDACSLPFDKRRTGLCLAEGAGIFLFEELTHALARRAKIYAEVLGIGENADASHITNPQHERQAAAIQRALTDAGVEIGDVDYVNAHGTGTPTNDPQETLALKLVFGERARQIPISSTKSVTGHALGASGAIELPAAIGAITHNVVPPTANLREADPLCDLDYVPMEARPHKVDVVVSQSFAFGGINSVIVLGRY